jgi:hypothetical protein
MRCRELDIAEAGGEELRARIGRRPGLARALRGEEAAEALGRERGEQRARIAKWCAGAAWLTPTRRATPRSEKSSVPRSASSSSAARSSAARRSPWW